METKRIFLNKRLAEKFYFDDGEISYRNWQLSKLNNGSYQGTAEDVKGIAIGTHQGFAFQFQYELLLTIDNSTYEVAMDDWMYQLDDYRVFNKTAMSKLGVTVDEVKNALNAQNMISPGGKFGSEPAPLGTDFTYGVSLQDRLVTEKEFGSIVVRSNEDGAQVLLSDISRIELGSENYSSSARRNSLPTAVIALYQMPGSNALEVAEAAKKTMKEIAEKFLRVVRKYSCVLL